MGDMFLNPTSFEKRELIEMCHVVTVKIYEIFSKHMEEVIICVLFYHNIVKKYTFYIQYLLHVVIRKNLCVILLNIEVERNKNLLCKLHCKLIHFKYGANNQTLHTSSM